MHVSVDDAGNQYFVVTQLDGFDRVDRRPSVRAGTVRIRRDRCDTPVPYDDGTVCFDAMRQYGAVDGQIRTRTVVLEIVAEVGNHGRDHPRLFHPCHAPPRVMTLVGLDALPASRLRDAAFNSVRNSRGFCCRVSRPFRWFGTVSSMPNPPDMRC